MTPRRHLLALVAAATLFAGGCGGSTRATFPPLGSTPAPVGDATAATNDLVIRVLAAASIQAVVATRAYRPPEGPLLAAAPRSVLQAVLPDDPGHGFIVVYALPSPAAAQAAAEDQAGYVASGLGRVQFTSDARFVLRVIRSTVLFYWWSPGAALDERASDVEVALETIDGAVEVPG